ncbi:hypothetical protein BDN72DRAFT_801467 [Pluteus cervinus]|uniref:Uncharacterized protein n=1 Tax=Pluteus cervinus TaxID=181527 RepID=A0ACD3AHM3_9AGAR|nr:hypothetical protein BDN72DRAFT_801467 [Pluteus cervinus]
MIIGDEGASKGQEEQRPRMPVLSAEGAFSDDPPPTYISSVDPDERRRLSSSPPPLPPKMPFGIKPTNFLYIKKKYDSIKESVAIDPTLMIPSVLLPPVSLGQVREDLKVESTYGSVNLDIWLVPGAAERSDTVLGGRAVLAVKSEYGSINTQLRTIPGPRPPIHLILTNQYGTIQARLPRSFTGLIFISTRHGGVKFSDSLQSQLTPFGEMKNERQYFLGDLSTWTDPNSEWVGDELVLTATYGPIKVAYEDGNGEGFGDSTFSGGGSGSSRRPSKSSRRGFFERVFAKGS